MKVTFTFKSDDDKYLRSHTMYDFDMSLEEVHEAVNSQEKTEILDLMKKSSDSNQMQLFN